jgi:hypothetical protein
MKSIFLVMMIAFGLTSIISAVATFSDESLFINHEPLMASLFYGCGFMGFVSSMLFSFKVN